MTNPPTTLSVSAPVDLSAVEQPKMSPKSGTFMGHAGRRMVSGTGPPSPDQQQGQASPRRRRGKQTMEELDRRVAEDALALVNMKREIVESQRGEVLRAQQLLSTLRKEHDALFSNNEKREREINALLDRARSLQVVDRGVKVAGSATQDFAANMVRQIAHSDDIQAAEQRTLNMQRLMLTRLEAEIADLRILSSKASYRLDTLRHELVGTDATLIVSKQELSEREHQLHKMTQSVKDMRKERSSKLGMLQAIIDDGEHSLSRVQGSVFEVTKSPKSRSSRGARTGTRESQHPSAPEELEDFDSSENRPEVLAKRLSVEQVREMVQRYNSRGGRLDRLLQLEAASKESVEFERSKRAGLQEQLEAVRDKVRALASSRQVYQEVEEKAKALAAARKACDECRERDVRLRANLESIKRAVPRFLSKITKSVVPVPSMENLPDAIQKLEDEILKLFKATSAAMLKDATPEDLLLLSQSQASSTPASESEIARLQKLPGFSKMQRTLFFNMMAAKPDNSDSNVRVPSVARRGENKEEASAAKSQGHGHLQLSLGARSLEPPPEMEDEHSPEKVGEDSSSLDRTTVKNISNLVIERDGGGWGKVLERRLAEERHLEMLAEKKKNKGKKRQPTW